MIQKLCFVAADVANGGQNNGERLVAVGDFKEVFKCVIYH